MIDLNVTAAGIQIAGFVITLITGIILGTRAISNMESSMNERLRDFTEGLSDKIIAAQKEADSKIDRQYREFGEGLMAIRHKITEVELFARDHFVRSDNFSIIQQRMTEDVRLIGEKIDKRLDNLEKKIDVTRRTQDDD